MRPADPVEHPPVRAERTVTKLRRASALIAVGSALGGLAELAMLRHWHGIQVAPWVIFVVIIAIGLRTAFGGSKRLAQIGGGLGIFGAFAGLWHHIDANHTHGPEILDNWDTFSSGAQWWMAFNGTLVDTAPALAPGLLGLAGVLLLVAVIDR